VDGLGLEHSSPRMVSVGECSLGLPLGFLLDVDCCWIVVIFSVEEGYIVACL
jgi:hypothetical protein